MAYKRQISYMDLIENEIKRGNAGFIKWEKYDECHILSVFVTGAEQSSSEEVEVLLGNGHSIGKLNIKNKRAEGTYLLTRGEKDWIEEIDVIRIPLGEGRELVAEFEGVEIPKVERTALQTENKEENAGAGIVGAVEATGEIVGKGAEIFTVNDTVQPTSVTEKMDEVQPQKEKVPEETQRAEEKISNVSTADVPVKSEELQDKREEKSFWEKMSETHELIYPFGNNVGCYRIFPKDINQLHKKYYALQNNQFLMHGYYNYRHLIIWPKKDSENEFWLGVPGIYHEREKMAARMFGFEKFEGTKREYRTGDLGYYLITVEG